MAHWALVVAALLTNLSPAMIPPGKTGVVRERSGGLPDSGLPEGIAIKPGVILRGLDERMHPVLRKARDIWLNHGRKPVITSGLDGRHSKGSRHYAGLALDFRSRDLDKPARIRAVHELQGALGREFRVLLEKDHIHVEHNPAPGPGNPKLARSSGPTSKTPGRDAAEPAKETP